MPILLLAAVLAAREPHPRLPLRPLVAALLAPPVGSAPILDQLRGYRETASERERAIIDRAIVFIEGARAPEWIQTHFAELVSLTRDCVALSVGDLASERTMVATFGSLYAMAASFDLDPAPLQRGSVSLARGLVTRHPQDGSSHGVLASALAADGAEPTLVARAYKKCVDLDATATHCVEALERYRTTLRAPRCTRIAKALGIYAGRAVAADAPMRGLRTRSENETLELENAAIVRAGEVAAATRADDALAIELSPAAAKRFAASTQRLSQSAGWVVLRVGDETLFSARAMESIRDGRLRIVSPTQSPDQLLARVCEAVVRPALPPDLR